MSGYGIERVKHELVFIRSTDHAIGGNFARAVKRRGEVSRYFKDRLKGSSANRIRIIVCLMDSADTFVVGVAKNKMN